MASTLQGDVQGNDVWLEASMLPQSEKHKDPSQQTRIERHMEGRKTHEGTSGKTRSTATGSQSSGDRVAQQSPPGWCGSGIGSVSDDGSSSERQEDLSEDLDSRRRLETGLQNAEAPPVNDDKQTSLEDSTKFASIFLDGPAFSVGSAEHPHNCQPCVHYCFSKRRGCNRGDDCSFCHSFHESRLQQKRQRWKGNKKLVAEIKNDPIPEVERVLMALQESLPSPPPAATPPSKRLQIKDPNSGKAIEVLKQSALEQLPLPKLAYADAQLAPKPQVPKLAYTHRVGHPLGVGHLGDPMKITPSNLGPPPGDGKLKGLRLHLLPPPGLDTFDEFPYSSFAAA